MVRRAHAFAVLLCLALAGCGQVASARVSAPRAPSTPPRAAVRTSSPSNEAARIRDVFIAFTEDVAHHNGKAACALMTPPAVLVQGCVKVGRAGLPVSLAATIALIKRDRVSVQGTSATITRVNTWKSSPSAIMGEFSGRWLVNFWVLPTGPSSL